MVCEKCEEIYILSDKTIKRRIKNNLPNLCKKCMVEYNANSLRRYWNNLDKSEADAIYKKSRETINGKSLDDKKKSIKKWHNSMNDRSDEEKHMTKIKQIQSAKKFYNSLSDGERVGVALRLTPWENMSEQMKLDIRAKRKHKRQNWSDDFKNDYNKNLSDKLKEFYSTDIGKQVASSRSYNTWENMGSNEKNNKLKSLHESRDQWYTKLSTDDRSSLLKKIHTSKHANGLNKKFESYFNASYISNKYYFRHEEVIIINSNTKSWDYGIYDKCTNELVMVVDLDGAYYHADNTDYTGIHSHEQYDERRYHIVFDNVKLCIIYELAFTKSFNNMIEQLILNYDEFIQSQFNLCRAMSFPYPTYTDEELMKSYDQLCKLNCTSKYIGISTNTRIGDRIINHFHHSIYSANRCGKVSPYDAWYNDELLMKVIRNRIIYVNSINPNKILQGFNISKIAQKVSVFSAGRAKLLIHKYLNEFDTIFDPFSGFSGRMLGTTSLNKKYIGQDISPIHVRESNKIIDFLSLENKANVLQQDILQSSGTYDCLFTCSPYSDKEIWYDVSIDTRSCDSWVDECLKRFKCKKYLFVVDNTERYKDYIVDTIQSKSHFGQSIEYVILI